MSTSLQDYSIESKLFESQLSIIYKAKRKSDGLSVIIKMIKGSNFTPEEYNIYSTEFKIASKLPKESFIQYYDFIKSDDSLALVVEDMGGESLFHYLKQVGQIPIKVFLDLAIKLAEALHKMHAAHLIHRDLNPANIIYNPKTGEVKISDFGSATDVKAEKMENVSVQEKGDLHLEGTLAYISPEQTGRLNRVVDYRTDFYALGASFYQLLTGETPFTFTDPAEMIHAQIARPPVPPHQKNTQIPPLLSELILKLLAKNPHERYQNALGLLFDLEKAREEYKQNGSIEPFTLGEKDLPLELKFPEKLYGREKEIEDVAELFKEVGDEPSLILIGGFSGIGKSSFVYALYQRISDQHLYLISGKYDQFLKGVPFRGFSQAFESFIDQILGGSDQTIQTWKDNLNDTLGGEAPALFEMIPKLELILGTLDPLPELEPQQHQIRFFRVFGKFISIVASKEHPLILFLDDLQWADQGSLNLIYDLIVNKKTPYLLIIGTFRDNEIDAVHPLTLLINKVKQEKSNFHLVSLEPLALKDTTQLIADVLRKTPEEVHGLANLCQKKTQGNPFYLYQFLKFLEHEKLLVCDVKKMTWTWDLEKIQDQSSTENVLDLLVHKMRRIPKEAQTLLQYAACIGNEFTLDLLSRISKLSVSVVYKRLETAIEVELIIPISSQSSRTEASLDASSSFCFLHDKVQQAAHAEIDKDEEKLVRWTIGSILRESLSEEKFDEHLLEIVEHLNTGKVFAQTDEQVLDLAELNLEAGKKAKELSIYSLAEAYLQEGISLSQRIEAHKNLKFNLKYEYALTKHLNDQVEEAKKILEDLLANNSSREEKFKIYLALIKIETTNSDYEKAISIGLEAFDLMGMKVKRSPRALDMVLEVLKVKSLLSGKSIEELYNRAEIQDEDVLKKLQIAGELILPTFLSAPTLFAYLNFKSLNFTLKYGNSQYASLGYLTYSIMLCGVMDTKPKSEETGYAYGDLSFRLASRYKDFQLRATLYVLFMLCIYHRRHPFSEAALRFEEGHAEADARLSGETVPLLVHHLGTSFLAGQPLAELFKKAEELLPNLEKVDDLDEKLNFLIRRTSYEGLLKGSANASNYENKTDAEFLDFMKKNHLARAESSFYLCKIDNTFWEEDYKKCLEYHEMYKRFDVIPYYQLVSHYFLYPLTLSALYNDASSAEKKLYKKEIHKFLKILEHRSAGNPENHLNKYHLVSAELTRIKGDYIKAISLYLQSIEAAQKYKLPHEEALAHELLGKCYLLVGDRTASKGHITAAHFLYSIWGASVKIKKIETLFPEITSYQRDEGDFTNSTINRSTIRTQNTRKKMDLDFNAILKSSQSISETINLADLIRLILQIMIENSGAQRGVILLERNDQLFIEGDLNIDNEITHLLSSTPFESSHIVPSSIIGFAFRTKQQVLLNDARRNHQFSKDPYLVKHQPKSLLCFPIVRKGTVSGVLYFENNIAENVFTQARLGVLETLASQVSISTENSRLYSTFEHFVPKGFLGLLGRKSIIDVQLGDSKEGVFSILFMDIRQFTSLSESSNSKDVYALLNHYFTEIEQSILKHHGFIDKYLGDAVLSIFPESASHAVKAAVDIHKTVRTLSQDRIKQGLKTIELGVGINTGITQFGLVGGRERMDITVISDATNIAARIESLTRYYGSYLLISDHTLEAMQDSANQYKTRVIDEVVVKGRSNALKLIEILDALPEALFQKRLKLLGEFNSGIDLYKLGKFEKALEVFKNCFSEDPSDLLYSRYVDRCEQFIQKGTPKDWNGVWKFDTK